MFDKTERKHKKILEKLLMVKELITILVIYLINFYLKTKYKSSTIDLSIQEFFDADPKPIQ